MQNLYRISLACGAVPLIVGVGFYLLWLITRLPVLATAAPCVILMSILLVFAGCVSLGMFGWKAFRTKDLPRERVWRAIVISAAILSANLPMTAGLVGQLLPKKSPAMQSL